MDDGLDPNNHDRTQHNPTQHNRTHHDRTHRDRILIVSLIVAVVVVGGYFATGMPGMDHSPAPGSATSPGAMDHDEMTFRQVEAEAFDALVSNQAFVANVHTPYEGEIAGTDAFIPYDRIAGDRRLPTDKNATVLLYCRSGRMSATAGAALQRAGYTNVVGLEGGMDAWADAGMAVTMRPSASSG